MGRFTGKAIVITGGSSGIGLYAAKRIVAEGGRVLVTGTNAEKLASASAEHPEIHALENNAADFGQAEALAAEAKRLFGEIDGAFLNAGVGAGAPLSRITPQLYHQLMDLNVGGVLFGAQALAPLIKAGGSILITASAAKDKGMAGAAIYSATKGAVRSMTKGLARELAPRSIRVNTISPGPIETPFFERLGRPAEQMAALEAHIKATNPMGRMGTVEEAAAVAAFLLSDEASYVTGSDYAVDGGEAQL
jgi:NAD(P)-dependent dehydrogenase (short-subunit alcohol dehydrogenase family)